MENGLINKCTSCASYINSVNVHTLMVFKPRPGCWFEHHERCIQRSCFFKPSLNNQRWFDFKERMYINVVYVRCKITTTSKAIAQQMKSLVKSLISNQALQPLVGLKSKISPQVAPSSNQICLIN